MNELLVNKPNEGVLQLQINRPEALNALNTNILCKISNTLTEVDTDNGIRCVVITGNQQAFAAGADVAELVQIAKGNYPEQERRTAWQQIRAFRKPIIAAVNGYVFGGGCELAMHADIIIASKGAQFAQPEVKLGIMPGAGGTQFPTRRAGKAASMWMNLTGNRVTAERALQMGLISDVVDEDALPASLALAEKIARHSLSSLIAIKKSINLANEKPLSESLLIEREQFLSQAVSNDGQEGINAFLEKRKPSFNKQ